MILNSFPVSDPRGRNFSVKSLISTRTGIYFIISPINILTGPGFTRLMSLTPISRLFRLRAPSMVTIQKDVVQVKGWLLNSVMRQAG